MGSAIPPAALPPLIIIIILATAGFVSLIRMLTKKDEPPPHTRPQFRLPHLPPANYPGLPQPPQAAHLSSFLQPENYSTPPLSSMGRSEYGSWDEYSDVQRGRDLSPIREPMYGRVRHNGQYRAPRLRPPDYRVPRRARSGYVLPEEGYVAPRRQGAHGWEGEERRMYGVGGGDLEAGMGGEYEVYSSDSGFGDDLAGQAGDARGGEGVQSPSPRV